MIKVGDVVRARESGLVIGKVKRYDEPGRFWVLEDLDTKNEAHKTGEELAGMGAIIRNDMGVVFFEIYRGAPSYQVWLKDSVILSIGNTSKK